MRNVSNEIQRFNPHQFRPNAPVVLHIPMNIGQGLQSHEIVDWTLNPNYTLNDDIGRLLRNGTPFIFYRDGQICGLHEANNYINAVDEIVQI